MFELSPRLLYRWVRVEKSRLFNFVQCVPDSLEVDFLRRRGESGRSIYFRARVSTVPCAIGPRRTRNSACSARRI